jgi:hypothetical protein
MSTKAVLTQNYIADNEKELTALKGERVILLQALKDEWFLVPFSDIIFLN